MRPIEIKDLVVGLLAIVLIAMAIGQYDELQSFARREAAQALKGWPQHRFFPAYYESKGAGHAKR